MEKQEKKKILVTGGAGFIGSNLVQSLLGHSNTEKVRVLDNLSTGKYKNIEEFESNVKFEFIKGDITDVNVCIDACQGMDLISHQAALGSVPRSIKDPLNTNTVNISGTLNIFKAAVDCGIKRVVFAASSSTYGDSKKLPKVEMEIGRPLSPYAVTKYVNELYADVFSCAYNFNYIGLRYFNVFGPKQDPSGAYAAVIPLFMQAGLQSKAPMINGDGTYSRDFTYVDNAVQANMLALFSEREEALNQIYNIACGYSTNLNQLWEYIQEVTGSKVAAEYGPVRSGDIPHSLADISKAQDLLGYNPFVKVKDGLTMSHNWYKQNL